MNTIKIKCRIVERISKGVLILATYLAAGIYSCTAQAQPIHTGIEGTYSIRNFKINSNIPELSNLAVLEEGGSVGAFAGTRYLKVNTRLGLYYSSASVPRTIDVVNLEVQVDFHPLQLIPGYTLPLSVYFTGGVGVDKIKFYGHYLKKDTPVNYSDTNEPNLGHVKQSLASVGVGITYQFLNVDFLRLFAEAKRSIPLKAVASTQEFNNTSFQNFSTISVGVSIGK